MAFVNICYGCLSIDRQLITVEDHAKLYRLLLLKKSNNDKKKLMMCWECYKILNNIHTFRMKITQAQQRLNKKSLTARSNLSNLIVTKKVNDYQIIIYEEEKVNIIPTVIKQESDEILLQSDIEIKNDDSNIKEEELKDENDDIENDAIENDAVGNEAIENDADENDSDDKADIKELDEVLVPIDLLEKKVEIKVEQGRKKRGVLNKKYRTIIMEDIPDKRSFYDVITVDLDTIKRDMEKKRNKSSKKQFQCQQCYCGFLQQKFYERHLAVQHSQKNKYECDVCGVRFSLLRRLTRHINEHFRRFLCKLCGTRFHNRGLLYMHFKHGPHGRRMECKKCGESFDCTKSREFFAHYRNMHGLVECDYCGMRSSTKSRLAHHIKIRHTEILCKICDIRFEKFDSLTQHNRRKHVVEASERNYCVECNLQFSNDLLYHDHVSRSVKHRVKPRIPCPECDRTYSKRSYMMNHYNLEHLKESKYVCPICQRSFLNGFRLRNHIKYTHEKAPKTKNHICSYCGRGFHTRRILDNHVRTHTGERPYECDKCPATFAQSTALKTHQSGKGCPHTYETRMRL